MEPMSEARKLRKLRRRARRLGRAVVRDLRRDDDLAELGVRFMRRGQELSFRNTAGVQVFFVAMGGHIEASMPRTDHVIAKRDACGFHVTDSEDRINDRSQWDELRREASVQMRTAVIRRIDNLVKAAYGDDPVPEIYDGLGRKLPPDGLHFGLWLKDVQIKAWIEQDNWYFHVAMRLPLGGFVIPVKDSRRAVLR